MLMTEFGPEVEVTAFMRKKKWTKTAVNAVNHRSF